MTKQAVIVGNNKLEPRRRILVTGVTGFIGARLLRLLLGEGHEVTALVRGKIETPTNLNVLIGELSSKITLERLVQEVRPEICIHLAWCARPETAAPRFNREMLAHGVALLTALSSIGCRTLVAGSCSEYGT